ncbi:MAG TPA: 3-hydroxybutyryl-CoA dehydrogenase [Nocardioidaceae bacterium]|nr:3-hydroxybutyryl-CoA dehydrogenase [Nocardioidaceae bacterium]
MSREFSTVGVIGLGTMGAGIAEVFARHGCRVVGVERTEDSLQRGRAHLQRSTDRARKRGKLSGDEQQAILDRMTFSTSFDDVGDCDLVVEAVVERLELKAEVFRQLDDIVSPDAVLATNTSSLSVTDIAAASRNPGRVIGMHFFNPAPVQQLVEVVRTVLTEPGAVADVLALAQKLGKSPVVCGDQAGFIANALLFGYLNRAVSMYDGGYAGRDDIDAAMRLACGYPMGPLALLDLIGLDTAYEILGTMYRQGRNRLHAPAPMLQQMVAAGLLGRKTGRGFYTYEAAGSPVAVDDAQTPAADVVPAPRRPIRTVGVVGTGATATGIAEVFTRGGYDVTCVGDTPADAGEEQAPGRFDRARSLHDLGDVDLVVEAVAEDLRAKQALFEQLDELCKPGAILATTTSSLPVIECARVTGRPGDVVGMHFFEPAPTIELVEVVSTVCTTAEVAQTARAVCADLGRAAVCCADRAGFVVNALLFPYLNDAVRMLEARYATADEIDTAMKKGCALPVGPFELLDEVGTDVALTTQRAIYRESREPGLAPAPLLKHLVTAGYHGRKTGRGFRAHSHS